jgi:hypothetical protein
MEQLKGPEAGTLTPKQIYNMNQRRDELKNFSWTTTQK